MFYYKIFLGAIAGTLLYLLSSKDPEPELDPDLVAIRNPKSGSIVVIDKSKNIIIDTIPGPDPEPEPEPEEVDQPGGATGNATADDSPPADPAPAPVAAEEEEGGLVKNILLVVMVIVLGVAAAAVFTGRKKKKREEEEDNE